MANKTKQKNHFLAIKLCNAVPTETIYAEVGQIQWTLLNVIMNNVTNRLIILEFLIPARACKMHYKYALIVISTLVIVIKKFSNLGTFLSTSSINTQ